MDDYFDTYFRISKNSTGGRELVAKTSYSKGPITIIRYEGVNYYNGMISEDYTAWFENQKKGYMKIRISYAY